MCTKICTEITKKYRRRKYGHKVICYSNRNTLTSWYRSYIWHVGENVAKSLGHKKQLPPTAEDGDEVYSGVFHLYANKSDAEEYIEHADYPALRLVRVEILEYYGAGYDFSCTHIPVILANKVKLSQSEYDKATKVIE